MARAATAAAPFTPRPLRAALLFLLLVAACQRAAGETWALGSQGRDKGRSGGRPSGDSLLTEAVVPAGAPVVTELRCQCLQTLQGIHIKNIQSVKVTSPGPHCTQTEVM